MRVCVTHDIFRNRQAGLFSVAENALWIEALLKVALSGTSVEISAFRDVTDGGKFDTAKVFEWARLPLGLDGWAGLTAFAGLELAPGLTELTDADLVVGFGLTPALINALDRQGVALIDLEISPLRFGRDFYFRARSNSREITQVLEGITIDERRVMRDIQCFIANSHRVRNEDPSVRKAAFFGQTQLDLALIGDGRIVSPGDPAILGSLKKVAAQADEFHIVPHPAFLRRIGHLLPIVSEIPNAILSELPAYAYLTDPAVETVVALSSSTLSEARKFGKTTRRLLLPDRDNPDKLTENLGQWLDVDDRLFSRDLWRALTSGSSLQACLAEKLADDDQRLGLVNAGLGRRPVTPCVPAPSVPPLPVFMAGESYEAAGADLPEGLFRFGWHAPEATAVWSQREFASLAFRLPGRAPVKVCLEGLVFAPGGTPLPGVAISYPGSNGFRRIRLDASDLRFSAEFELAPDHVNRVVPVCFRISSPKSPAMVGLSGDLRELGIGLQKVSLEVLPGESEPCRISSAVKLQVLGARRGRGAAAMAGANPLTLFSAHLGDVASGTVVECACGNGDFVAAMAGFAGHVYGLDWVACELFPRSQTNTTLVPWDPFADGVHAGNLICSGSFLDKLEPEDFEGVVAKILRAGPLQFHCIGLSETDEAGGQTAWLERVSSQAEQLRPQSGETWRSFEAPVFSGRSACLVLTNIPAETLGL